MSIDMSKTNIPECQNCYCRVYFEKIINVEQSLPYLES